MTINPFIADKHYTFAESPVRSPVLLPFPASPTTPDVLPPPTTELETKEAARRLFKRVVVSVLAFLIVVLFVSREIQHTQELYQMSRMVTAAEVERRQWQEKVRLEEGRYASLMAVMHANPIPTDPPELVNAVHTVQRRHR